MKKITLLTVFVFASLTGFAQESKESESLDVSLERQSEYIIVLDDVTVGDNIDMLLNDSSIERKLPLNFNNHELVHDAPDATDIESKFVEGAFTFNEYALNYTHSSWGVDQQS